MGMSRKDYEAIAAVIAEQACVCLDRDEAEGAEVLTSTAEGLANLFEDDNPRFDRVRFIKACGI